MSYLSWATLFIWITFCITVIRYKRRGRIDKYVAIASIVVGISEALFYTYVLVSREMDFSAHVTSVSRVRSMVHSFLALSVILIACRRDGSSG